MMINLLNASVQKVWIQMDHQCIYTGPHGVKNISDNVKRLEKPFVLFDRIPHLQACSWQQLTMSA